MSWPCLTGPPSRRTSVRQLHIHRLGGPLLRAMTISVGQGALRFMADCSHQPPKDCPLCPRLMAFRQANRIAYPDFFNDPVRSFGALDAKLLIVGLAPGLKGAN